MKFYALMLVVLLLPAAVRAADFSVGVVDVTAIYAKAEAAKSIEVQRDKLRGSFLSEISETEKELRQEELALSKAMESTNKEEYAKRHAAYEENLIKTRKMAQEKKRVLEEASNKAMDKLRDELYIVVQEIANERGYKLVISNRDVIAGEKSLDITEEALKRLNERVETIDLEIKESRETE